MTLYANQTFGTVTGVRKKLSSPEIARGLIKVNDTRIGITVNTTSDVVTTGIAHGFTVTDSIGFENTGGLLPAPLTTLTAYYPVNITTNTFQVATVVGGSPIDLTTVGTGTNSVYRNSMDLIIQTALDDTKNTTFKNHLLIWLRDVMPDTIDKWVNLRSVQFVNYHDRFNLDTFPIFGMFTGEQWSAWFFNGGSISTIANPKIQTPTTFYTDSPPINGTSGTLAGNAVNGDRLIDTVARKLYINRETDNPPVSPVWDRQNHEDGLNYILNPDSLAQPHEYLAIARLYTLGVDQNRPEQKSTEEKTFMMDREAYWHNKFIGSWYGEFDEHGRQIIPGVNKIVQIDFSGSNDFGDFEREMAGDQHYGFA